jgi:hypothetical protein
MILGCLPTEYCFQLPIFDALFMFIVVFFVGCLIGAYLEQQTKMMEKI